MHLAAIDWPPVGQLPHLHGMLTLKPITRPGAAAAVLLPGQECNQFWFNRNQRCHTCNLPVRHNEWYNISYKEIKLRDKDAKSNDSNNKSTSSWSDEVNEKSREHLNTLIQNINTTVFIVEPVFNESLEKQAINRVHRIEQTKETSVFWYIVQDTIEERIQAIHDRKRNLNCVDIDDDLALTKLTDGAAKL
ncbi:hypothetical protein INT47_010141 [Mucor saturninus]|uniref:Uncharacterized protein n=1 Tax=Mucor saturninus TaxID=64648 RepID=A0A8H7V5Z3_9FUNG|nr:hypothetical protein INT47_010141 [Mucor saturninus]